ncbi:hypothetical protein EXM30_02860 [Clostridium botulinum]|uniref:hypothetical protein n=1 Tax=Clostridium botulinum TaxID=1491 RepID=UPI00126982A8|nr:hypothetical protein [Clostridium botulinum]NEZ73897.1 hypothetical protein [Clostridium botulinum]NEZ98626.1 hypothetical protein [Clostridium botulinum]NFA29822.1 hypothetical protein [Clostridium botulinum]NFA84191.1 hypothetical protein [Clostridium botulinum]NFA91876.1 hypothetical protein [Clostridium botulinum]
MKDLLKNNVKEAYDFKKVNVPEKLLEIEIRKNLLKGALKDVSERFLTIEEVGDAITAGDIISADLESSIANFNKKKVQISVGRGFLNEELEDELLEMKKNEIKRVSMKAGFITIRIISVKRRIFALVTDELIKKLNIEGVNTIDEYKKYICNRFINQSKDRKMGFIGGFIVKEVIAKSEFESIDEEVKAKYEDLIEQTNLYAEKANMSYEEYIKEAAAQKLKNPTVEESEKLFYDNCVWDVKYEQLGLFYALRDGIEFNQETYEKKLSEIAHQEGISCSKLKEMISFSHYMSNTCMEYFNNVINEFFKDKFVVKGYISQTN